MSGDHINGWNFLENNYPPGHKKSYTDLITTKKLFTIFSNNLTGKKVVLDSANVVDELENEDEIVEYMNPAKFEAELIQRDYKFMSVSGEKNWLIK